MEVQLPSKTMRVMLAGMTAAESVSNGIQNAQCHPLWNSVAERQCRASWFWRIPCRGSFEDFGKSLPSVMRIYPSPSDGKVPDSEVPTCPNRFGFWNIVSIRKLFAGRECLWKSLCTANRSAKITGMYGMRLRYASLTE